MAWKTIYDDTITWHKKIPQRPETITFFNVDPLVSMPQKIKINVDNYEEILPHFSDNSETWYYGEYDASLKPIFVNFHLNALYILESETISSENWNSIQINSDTISEGDHHVQIFVEDTSPTPSKSSTTLGVKEAMQHFIKSIDESLTPATTIKKLTKQMLDPDGEVEAIQKARTIADIWEQSAIAHGYKPDEGGDEPSTTEQGGETIA